MKKIINKVKFIFLSFINIYKENWKQWTLLLLFLAIATASFLYADLLDTTNNSIIFFKTLFNGQFLNFYEISVKETTTAFAANYNIPIYIIYSIWLMPGYIIAHLLNKNFMKWPIGLLHSKLLLIIATIIASYLIYKIILECSNNLQKNKSIIKTAPFIFLSSVSLLYSVFISSQLDIISLCFMLLGLLGYIKHNNKLFIISFIIAAPLKMFSILIFIPLILLREKNLFKAGLLTISTLSLLIIEKIIFSGSAVYNAALSSQSRDGILKILNSTIVVGKPIIIFIALYLCLLVYTFISNRGEDKNIIVYIPFYVYATFCAFLNINSYWIILLLPFLIINIFVNKRLLGLNILLETISSFFYFLYMGAVGSAVFTDTNLTNRLLIRYLYHQPNPDLLKYRTLYNFFTKNNLTIYSSLFQTIFVVSLILILIITCPLIKKEIKSEYNEIKKWSLYLRVGTIGFCTLLIIYINNVQTNPIYYSNLNQTNEYEALNLIDSKDDNTITQKINFNDDISLKELALKFYNSHYSRSNFAIINIELWNISNNKCIFKDQIGASLIENNKYQYINLKNTKVNKNDNYEIRISGDSGISYYSENEKMYIYLTDKQDDSLDNIIINNESKEKVLYFQIR